MGAWTEPVQQNPEQNAESVENEGGSREYPALTRPGWGTRESENSDCLILPKGRHRNWNVVGRGSLADASLARIGRGGTNRSSPLTLHRPEHKAEHACSGS